MAFGESRPFDMKHDEQLARTPARGSRTKGPAWILALCLALVAFHGKAAGGSPLSFGKPDFELTGRVYEGITKEPIEGAYVVALYYVDITGPAALTSHCKRVKGMYTGKDGTFHFPVEKLDGNSPGMVMAIKPGYFSLPGYTPPASVQRKQGKEAYTGRDLPLQKQNPQKPSWQFGHGDVYCTGAEWREDVEAAIEFLKLKLAEEQRLGARKQGLDALRRMIEELDSRPAQKGRK